MYFVNRKIKYYFKYIKSIFVLHFMENRNLVLHCNYRFIIKPTYDVLKTIHIRETLNMLFNLMLLHDTQANIKNLRACLVESWVLGGKKRKMVKLIFRNF